MMVVEGRLLPLLRNKQEWKLHVRFAVQDVLKEDVEGVEEVITNAAVG